MILLNRLDKTKDIVHCNYENGKYRIVFIGNEKTYSYAFQNVRWLKNPVVINPNHVQLSYQGKRLFEVQRILQFDAYLRIFFKDGCCRTYANTDMRIERNELVAAISRNCLSYFKQVAMRVGLKNEDGKSLLASQLEKMTFVSQDSALAAYLNRKTIVQSSGDSVGYIYPFGHNLSQMAAVKLAMRHQISVIEGPPGTGKTQTILNLIANILIRGKTVAVVSNNNAATANVSEKLEKYGFGFMTATLGRHENKQVFIAGQDGRYPYFLYELYDANKIQQIWQDVSQLEKDSEVAHRYENELASLRSELSSISVEQTYYEDYLTETNVGLMSQRQNIRWSTKQILLAILKSQSGARESRIRHLINQVRCWFGIGLPWKRLHDMDEDSLAASLRHLYYKQKCQELEIEIKNTVTKLERLHHQERLAMLTGHSLLLLKNSLACKYRRNATRPVFSTDDLWKNPEAINKEYPVILSTTHSIRSSLSQHMYDFIIVDEASQVDLVTAVLALSCAKNAVIVGDLMQLPNVVSEVTRQLAAPILDAFSLDPGYVYTENSLLSSVCKILPTAPRTFLREHYRCHPKIIGFCNQKFYQNQLIILTQDDQNEDVVKIYRTVAGNHARVRANQRQIDEIRVNVLPELEKLVDREAIGIISPYRDQAEALMKTDESSDLDIATVHKFQGREKEAIIITTVDNEIGDFVDNPNLLNVAVSRARRYLRLVVSENEKNEQTNIGDLQKYIQYNNFATVKGTVYSVFDMLYKDYAAVRKSFLSKHKRISEYDSENLMAALIMEILQKEEFSQFDVAYHVPLNMVIRDRTRLDSIELAYAQNNATHLDCLIYNRFDKKPVLAIEVDGYAFHGAQSVQARRDEIKNTILEKYSIVCLRFKTNGSQEREKLEVSLRQLMSVFVR